MMIPKGFLEGWVDDGLRIYTHHTYRCHMRMQFTFIITAQRKSEVLVIPSTITCAACCLFQILLDGEERLAR